MKPLENVEKTKEKTDDLLGNNKVMTDLDKFGKFISENLSILQIDQPECDHTAIVDYIPVMPVSSIVVTEEALKKIIEDMESGEAIKQCVENEPVDSTPMFEKMIDRRFR